MRRRGATCGVQAFLARGFGRPSRRTHGRRPRRRSTSRSRRRSRTSRFVGLPGALRPHRSPRTTTRPSPAAGSSCARRSTSSSPTRFRLGVRGVFDYGTEPNIDNALNYDNYHLARRVPRPLLPRCWTPGALDGPGRRLRHAARRRARCSGTTTSRRPARRSRMRRRSTRARASRSTAAGFYSAQHYRDESLLGVGQVVWNRASPAVSRSRRRRPSGTLDMRDLDPAVLPREPRDRRERPARVRVEVRASRSPRPAPVPRLRAAGDGRPRLHPQLRRRRRQGTQRLRGRPDRRRGRNARNWRAFFVYQYIGRDALVGAYNTDDWWLHTWAGATASGSRTRFCRGSTSSRPSSSSGASTRHYWIKRVTVDLVKMF